MPDATPQGGTHEIIALVTDDDTGETTEEIPVASYDSPPEVEPSAVSALQATRSGSNVTISWGYGVRLIPGSIPIAFNVDVTTSTGEELLDVVPLGTLSDTIPNIDPSTGLQITVRPMRHDDTQGPPAHVTLSAGQSSTQPAIELH